MKTCIDPAATECRTVGEVEEKLAMWQELRHQGLDLPPLDNSRPARRRRRWLTIRWYLNIMEFWPRDLAERAYVVMGWLGMALGLVALLELGWVAWLLKTGRL